MKKLIQNKIDSFINMIATKLFAKLDERITKLIKEDRYSWLPHGSCWLCSHPISRDGGYSSWRGRLFCDRQCVERFSQLISHPSESYRVIDGDPVETVKKRNT